MFVPDGNNPDKNAAMRAYGAVVEEGGKDFDEARERCEARARQTGARYVHSADEPLLIAGVGTYALEVFEELPNADVIFVPIGGGSGACGLITVRNALGSKAKIIGVGAVNADAVYRSWKGAESCRRRFRQHLRRRHRHARQLRFAVQHLQARISMTSSS